MSTTFEAWNGIQYNEPTAKYPTAGGKTWNFNQFFNACLNLLRMKI